MTGAELALAAEQFIGRPFRLHGRDPQTGLDCIGLLECSFRACGLSDRLPNGYSLRTGRWNGLGKFAAQLGFAPSQPPFCCGDICLFQPSPVQLHFAIIGTPADTIIEAHAGLRKVVSSPLPDLATMAAHWRLQPEN